MEAVKPAVPVRADVKVIREHFILQVSHPSLERDHQSFHPTEHAMGVCLKEVLGRIGNREGGAERAKVRRVVVTEAEMLATGEVNGVVRDL